MKFNKTHTVDDMIRRARNEADGYFEVAFSKGAPITSTDVLSVTVVQPGDTAPYTRSGRRVTWRCGTSVISRSAAADRLEVWRTRL